MALADCAVALRMTSLVGGMCLYVSKPQWFVWLFLAVVSVSFLAAVVGARPESRFSRVFQLVFGRFESTFLLCVVSVLSKDDIRFYVLVAVTQYLSLWISVYRYLLPSKLLTKEAIQLVHSAPYRLSLFQEASWFVADVTHMQLYLLEQYCGITGIALFPALDISGVLRAGFMCSVAVQVLVIAKSVTQVIALHKS